MVSPIGRETALLPGPLHDAVPVLVSVAGHGRPRHCGHSIGGGSPGRLVPMPYRGGGGLVDVPSIPEGQGAAMMQYIRARRVTSLDWACVIFLASVIAVWCMGGGVGPQTIAGGAMGAVLGGTLLHLQKRIG